MNTPKNVLVLLLAATTLGGAILAWRQYGELVELRAAAVDKDERADLQKRVADLESLNRDLQARLVARGPNDVDDLLANAAAESERPGRERRLARGDRGEGRGRGDAQGVAIRQLMNTPEVQAMLTLQQKAALDSRYAALFKNLNLPPEQLEKLKTLLAERGTTMRDIMSVAREQGISPRENPEAFQKLMADAQNEINNSIKAVIGQQGFDQLANYERTLPQRNLVNDLQQRLSYTNAPLTSAQAEQVVQILAANGASASTPNGAAPATPTPQTSGRVFMGGGMGFVAGPVEGGRGGVAVTDAAITQAQTVLTPAQVSALQQIQQQQQAQQQLRKLVSDAMTANQPAATNNAAGGNAGSGGSATNPSGAGRNRKGG